MRSWIPIAAGAILLLGIALRLGSTPILDQSSFSKVFKDREGRLLRLSLAGDEKYRIYTPLEEIDPKLLEAFLLQEDRYFRWHPGVNPVALTKVFLEAARGERMRGASTITMQLVRLLAGEPTRSVSAKFAQIAKALWLEVAHSKDEILEAYLNLAPFGANIEGVGAASLVYFSKSAKSLKLGEVIALALIPQSPSQRSLHIDSEALRSWKLRRQQLLGKWQELHPEASEREIEIDLPLASRRLRELPFEAPHLTERLDRSDWNPRNLETSLDLVTQNFIEERLSAFIAKKKERGVRNGSAMLVNYETGQVIAYVGSENFLNSEIFGQNDGVVARRSPGSSLKPFVYALAIEQGLVHTQTLLKDTPRNFGSFEPENFDRAFLGPLSTEDALIRSRNIPAIELSSRVTAPTLYQFLKSQEIALPFSAEHYGFGVALGGAEFSLEDLVRLYAGLARGRPLKTLSYEKLTRAPDSSWALSRESAWLVLQMLSRNPRDAEESFLRWSRQRLSAAWKTGTSSGFRDAWTIGVFGPYVLGVWIGNFSGEANPVFVGREIAAPLFFEIAEGLAKNENFETADWSHPLVKLNVKKTEVCALSGAEPEAFCPHRKTAWVIPGKSPISKCKIHRSILVNLKTSLRSCGGIEDPKLYRPEVFEFWPSDLRESFLEFGIHKAQAPSFEARCASQEQESMLHSHAAPEIMSPRKEVVYSIRLSELKEGSRIPLQAVADGDVRKLDWFVGATHLGRVSVGETFFWKARRGKHMLTVVDDQGSTQTQWLEVQYVP